MNVSAYIDRIANEYSDTFATTGTSDKLSTYARVIPHHDVTSFFKEYQYYCKEHDVEPEYIAELTTFRSVYNSMEKEGMV